MTTCWYGLEFMAWDGRLYGVEDANQLNVGINFNF